MFFVIKLSQNKITMHSYTVLYISPSYTLDMMINLPKVTTTVVFQLFSNSAVDRGLSSLLRGFH